MQLYVVYLLEAKKYKNIIINKNTLRFIRFDNAYDALNTDKLSLKWDKKLLYIYYRV